MAAPAFLAPMLASAGIGLGKHLLFDKPQEDRQRELAATTAAYSPWTGMTPEPVQAANAFNTVSQGALAGAQFGQGLERQDMMKDQLELEKERMRAQQDMYKAQTAMFKNVSPWQQMR